jgi:hypothetical protein
MTSPELTGGAGFTFEDAVAAYYILSLLSGTTAAGLSAGTVNRVAQQQADFGYPLDDVVVDAATDDDVMTLSLQVKRALTISAAPSNVDFREVIQRSWQTLQLCKFRKHIDRVGTAVGTISDESYRNFSTICEWARASESSSLFFARFDVDGNASQVHSEMVTAVRSIVEAGIQEAISDDQLHALFAHLVIIKFDFLHEGSSDQAHAISKLQLVLAPEHIGRAPDVWSQLRQLARDGAGRCAEFSRASALRKLSGGVRFSAIRSLVQDLQTINELTSQWLIQQPHDIGGMHLDRSVMREKLLAEINTHRLTLIKGLPGTGKTVLLRDLLSDCSNAGSTLFLSAGRLSGRSWTEFSNAIGLKTTAIEPLLVEISATGTSILFIDGLDRIFSEHRPIIIDVVSQIFRNPNLTDWKVVASARDTGIEPLRNWLPTHLLDEQSVGYVEVDNITEEEAFALAAQLPALKPLLLGGDERVRRIARRPFFASVLARGFSCSTYNADFAPKTEIDLVDAWWSRGGYDVQDQEILSRQRALMELAELSAAELGQNIKIRDLSTPTHQLLFALENDGLVQQVRSGHVLQFSHDIFFEWTFYHLLSDYDDEWHSVIERTGEPPALARCVELLSQSTYSNLDQWLFSLRVLNAAPLRSQWLRAWLLAPVFSADFLAQTEGYSSLLFDNDHSLFGKLLVWMQAEKVTPNPLVLSGELGADMVDIRERIRLADSLGIPSDLAAWGRLLHWIMDHINKVSKQFLPDVVKLFQTWQIAVADFPNPVSNKIVQQCCEWMKAIDLHENSSSYWNIESTPDSNIGAHVPVNLKFELRSILLRSSRSYPASVNSYLSHILDFDRFSEDGYGDVILFAPILAQTHAALLSDVSRSVLLKELPDETATRWREEEQERAAHREEVKKIPEDQWSRLDELMMDGPHLPNQFSSHDWETLSVRGEHQGYFPVSPLREPFLSLLRYAPSVALQLIRDFANHATTAWIQFHKHMSAVRPVSLTLNFPWGNQEFWGTVQQYKWFRGHGGPQLVECALVSLEKWAIESIDSGRAPSDVIREVVEGHSSIGVLGIAVHLSLKYQEVSATTLPLVSSFRLWRLDIRRYAHEPEFQSACLIGFDLSKAGDLNHRQAVIDMNSLPSRRLEVRSLATLFVLGTDEKLRTACCEAIKRFPDQLQFEYEQDELNDSLTAQLKKNAKLWSEWGHPEYYTTIPIQGSNDAFGIELRSPLHSAPEVKEVQKQNAQLSLELDLWSWVEKCFELNTWASGYTPLGAVEQAKNLLASANEEQSMLEQDYGLVDGAICGTAAALYRFTDPIDFKDWADSTLSFYCDQQRTPDEHAFPTSVMSWHPKIFVARGIAARIRKNLSASSDRLELYRLVGHRLHVVSLCALEEVGKCWSQDFRFAWCGLNLGMSLSQTERAAHIYNNSQREERDATRRKLAIEMAYRKYESEDALPMLTMPLPSWLSNESPEEEFDDENEYSRSDNFWMADYAISALNHFPLDHIMRSDAKDQYIAGLEGYLAWTLNTLNPPFRAKRNRKSARSSFNLYKWEYGLGSTIGKLAPHIALIDMQEKFLQPIGDQPDEIAICLHSQLTRFLVCAEVLDAPKIEINILEILNTVLDRMLLCTDLRLSEYNDCRISGFDLPELIKSLLFVIVERADGSKRFANGDWSDLNSVIHLVDKMVGKVGWHPFVMENFLVLCERAASSYPAEIFADQLVAQIKDSKLPSNWKGTTIPASIAGLIQEHADRLDPLPSNLATKFLRIIDGLIDLGDRRSAALQQSQVFRGVRFKCVS